MCSTYCRFVSMTESLSKGGNELGGTRAGMTLRLLLLLSVVMVAASPAPQASLLPPFGWSAHTVRPNIQDGTVIGVWISPSGDANIALAERPGKGTLVEAHRALLKAEELSGGVIVHDRAVRICGGK